MKTLESQNHYEVLEVTPGARPEEIDRAYRLATAAWGQGSLALYSLFDEADAAAIRERVAQAYEVLSDERARRSYDAKTFDSPPAAEPDPAPSGRGSDADRSDEDFDEFEIALESALEDGDPGTGEGGDPDYDGARLRRSRMNRGVELEEIGRITKITLTYLRAIEEEAFDTLPAEVYVRGFVTAYARAIGLDPKRVAASYMPRFEEARKEKGRGRMLGRR